MSVIHNAPLRGARLALTGAIEDPATRYLRTRDRAVDRVRAWIVSAFAIGGALGLAYHVLAPALVRWLQTAWL